MRRFIYLFLVLCFYSEFSFANTYYSTSQAASSACWASAQSTGFSSWSGNCAGGSLTSVSGGACYSYSGANGLKFCFSSNSGSCTFSNYPYSLDSKCLSSCPSGTTANAADQCIANPPDTPNNICSAYVGTGTTFDYVITVPAGEDPSSFSPPSSITHNGCKATFGGGDGSMACIQNPDTSYQCSATGTYTGEAAPAQENGDPAPDSGEECGVEGKPACPSNAPPLPYNCTSTDGVYTCVINPNYPGNSGGSSEGGEGSSGGEGGTGGSSGGTGGSGGEGTGTGDGEGSGTGEGETETPGQECDPATDPSCATSSVSGTACDVALDCSGDAIQCAMLSQQKQARCAAEELADFESKKSDIQSLVSGENFELDESETIDVSSFFNTNGRFLPSSSCPQAEQLNLSMVGGHSFQLSYEPLCRFASDLSYLIVVAASVFFAVYIGRSFGG